MALFWGINSYISLGFKYECIERMTKERAEREHREGKEREREI